MTDPNLPTRTEGEGETLDMPEGLVSFTSGQVLGERYQILEDLSTTNLPEIHQRGVVAVDLSKGMVVSGDAAGNVWVGPISEGDHHLLPGHESPVVHVSLSPDGKWILSVADDGTLRLWPTPDFARRPLYSLPKDDLVGKLERLTNLRVVPDEGSATGYRFTIDFDGYGGFGEVPEW